MNLISKEENDLIYELVVNIEKYKNINSKNFIFGPYNHHVQVYCDYSHINMKGVTPCNFFKNKAVVYLAFTKDNESNFGKTMDFGQRLNDYSKDIRNQTKRNKNHSMYKSAKRLGEIYFIPIMCRDFSSFPDGRKEAEEWARQCERLLHERERAIGNRTSNILI